MFAIFDNLESFNVWHNSIKDKLNYPLIGNNAATDEPDYDNPTTNYTKPLFNENDSRIIVWVGDQLEGLTLVKKEDYLDWFIVKDITIPENKVSND